MLGEPGIVYKVTCVFLIFEYLTFCSNLPKSIAMSAAKKAGLALKHFDFSKSWVNIKADKCC